MSVGGWGQAAQNEFNLLAQQTTANILCLLDRASSW